MDKSGASVKVNRSRKSSVKVLPDRTVGGRWNNQWGARYIVCRIVCTLGVLFAELCVPTEAELGVGAINVGCDLNRISTGRFTKSSG